jgi:hypothetical protein
MCGACHVIAPQSGYHGHSAKAPDDACHGPANSPVGVDQIRIARTHETPPKQRGEQRRK